MAQFEVQSADHAPVGGGYDGNTLYRLGLACADAPIPGARIEAHKWFNIAAMRGNAEAALLRQELAAEMTPAEIAGAQRAAREWLTLH
jgi:TPR repeat protein